MEGLELRHAFWQGKRVFVTGHTGFKGGWLSLLLSELGAEVQGYALAPPTNPSLFDAASVGELVASTIGDIRDFDALQAAMRAARPEIVIHLAAQPLVRLSYRDPITTYSTNVMGTVHVLECVRRLEGVRAVVNVTSDKCYENVETRRAYEEHQAMGGHDPYSSSKGCAELVTSAYRSSYFSTPADPAGDVALATARAGNVIGGGDWGADRLLPDILRSFGRGQSVEIRNPRAIRPWQHVLDPLGGYLMLAERLASEGQALAEGWNFGPGDEGEWPVADVVDCAAKHWGGGAAWHLSHEPHPHEAKLLKLDCTKAHTRLGWKPRLTLETALQWTVEWHRSYLAGANARNLCQRQIAAFLQAEKENTCTRPSVAFAKAS
jgi:CDP-glucose 4,6-dehydratase